MGFCFNSVIDEELNMKLKGLCNKRDGLFASKKQAKFMLEYYRMNILDQTDVDNLKTHFGIIAEVGQYRQDVGAEIIYASGARGHVLYNLVFILDQYGVVAYYRLRYQGNLRDGFKPVPEKTETMWTRTVEPTPFDEEPEVEVDPSNFVGSLKERLKDLTLEVTKTISYTVPSFKGYGYDDRYINLMKDAIGNVLVWKTDRPLSGTVTLDGTVKEHTEYNGVKQTVLTRCKVKGE